MSKPAFVAQWLSEHEHGTPRRSRVGDYTPQDDAILCEMAGKELKERIAERLGRSVWSVRTRAKNLHVSLVVVRKNYWSSDELDTLRKLAKTHTTTEIARMLGRTENAVKRASQTRRIRLQKYGEAHHSASISDAQVQIIREYRASGMYVREIAARMDLPFEAVRSIADYRTRIIGA